MLQESNREDGKQGSGANSFVSGASGFGRRLALATLGTAFLGLVQAQAFFARAAERGQRMETDAARLLAGASEHSTEVMSSGLATALNRLPGVRVVYQPPAQPEQPAETAAAEPENME